jgi:G3E family GTPase
MNTEIYIVSGFLGAGKTTLIQKLLHEAFGQQKVALIENDFGEISVDSALLKTSGIEVKEINSGCICCSLSGDFVKALRELLEHFHPDKIIIEPSGVGKLSDIVKACSDHRIQPFAKIKTKITVADAKRCKKYLDNFGEFFEDQVKNADVILLSHTDISRDKSEISYRLIKDLNPHAMIFSVPWSQISADDILYPGHKVHTHLTDCVHEHSFNCDHHHEHSHAADDIFDTVTIRTKQRFSIEDLKGLISNMEQNSKGTIIRAKGIVHSKNGYVNLQYLPGNVQITECSTHGDMLCFIGQNLNQQELSSLFNGE